MQRRGVGPSPSRFKTWGPGQRHARSGRRSSRLPDGERSISSWSGDWTAGGGRWWTWSTRSKELNVLDVEFVSLCEALDLTTPSGRALAGMLAVFAEFERDILWDRVKAGIEQARKDGKPHGRPMTAGKLVPEMKQLRKEGLSKREITKRLGVSRTSVIRLLRLKKRP